MVRRAAIKSNVHSVDSITNKGFIKRMATFHDLTTTQLKQAVRIREQIQTLQEKLDALLGGDSPKPKIGRNKGKRKMSAAGRASIAAAQKARWAKINGKSSAKGASKAPASTKSSTKSSPKKRTFTPETKAKLAAAMKARWAARKKGAPALNA